MPFNLDTLLSHVTFSFRNQLLGRIPLRIDRPKISLDTQDNLNEQKYYRTILSKAFKSDSEDSIQHVIDVGCRNWSYVKAISDFFPNAKLTGLEVDGGRRYVNLFRRKDVGQAFSIGVGQLSSHPVTYLDLDFLHFEKVAQGEEVLFCFLFPFVSENPCLKWGLPPSYANFKVMLEHASELTKRFRLRSQCISSHQGQWELELARKAYESLNLSPMEATFEVEEFQTFWPSPYQTTILSTGLNG